MSGEEPRTDSRKFHPKTIEREEQRRLAKEKLKADSKERRKIYMNEYHKRRRARLKAEKDAKKREQLMADAVDATPEVMQQAQKKNTRNLSVPPTVPIADLDLTASGGLMRPRSTVLQPTADTLERVRQLAILQVTQAEAAAVMLVSASMFNRFLKENEEAREAWEMGAGAGKVSLRRAQFVMAHRSATMAIWLGKQLLGQSDKIEEKVDQRVTHEITQAPDFSEVQDPTEALRMFESFRSGSTKTVGNA